jgi:putative FmdB family regulatory protein
MHLYEFECDACKSRFERIQKFSDANPDVCPTCGKGPIKRLLSSPAIQFKGSGFYITDYAKKSSPDASSSSKSGSEKSGSEKSGSEKSGSDSKSGDGGSTSPASSTPASTSASTDGGSSSSDKKS